LPRTLLAHNPDFDIDGNLIYSPKTRDVVGVYDRGEDGSRIYWDEGYEALSEGIDEALPDTTNYLQSLSRDERRYLIFATSDVNPGIFYYGDRDQGSLTPFTELYPELSGAPLSGKQPLKYTARDGLVIQGYLTRPWGDPPKPWPTVIYPHGGPSARDYKDFDYATEFLASRGYAVLQMNFRGSSGYGWKFKRSGFKELGGRMQDDVTDGAQWMVEQGYASADRICIMGASYGGYAALWGVVKTPDLYRCAISLNGVSDWGLILADSHLYVNGETIRKQLGNRTDLKQHSPLRSAADIRVPVLLVHGKKDRVVLVEHSRKMAKALKKHHKPHRYIELENGVHSLTNEHNRTEYLKAIEMFLAENLSKTVPR
jgi:dipeptidyl aminopeptidase/acylaminoacyl peptidase